MSPHRSMTDNEMELFEAFKLAIESERTAQGAYARMASLAGDPQVRAVFEGFQREEAEHEERLIQLYGEHKARFIPE
jgi:rubrerythrin